MKNAHMFDHTEHSRGCVKVIDTHSIYASVSTILCKQLIEGLLRWKRVQEHTLLQLNNVAFSVLRNMET